MPTQAELIEWIDAFLARHPAIGETRFGRDTTGESGLVARLRKGSSPTLRIAQKIVDYMAEKDSEGGVADHGSTDTVTADAQSPGIAVDVSHQVAA